MRELPEVDPTQSYHSPLSTIRTRLVARFGKARTIKEGEAYARITRSRDHQTRS